jgi:carbon-monoxide dehydrogenase small subunit
VTGPIDLTFSVNGRARTLRVEPHHTLLDVLRDDLGLTGTKECCLVGECGACTVMVGRRSIDSCLAFAAEFDGAEITTVEGLATTGELSPLQQAFLDTGAAQCGFCIPGQLIAAHALLSTTAHPTRAEVEEGLAGNLCRCAGYEQIIEAVLLAAGGDGATTRPARVASATDRADPAATPDAGVAPQ